VLELEDSTEALLMEALRQLDEFRRIADSICRRPTPKLLQMPAAARAPAGLS
jgi:hypothetical protein